MEAFLPEHKRTIYCGQVRPEHIGKEVVLCGWVHRRRDHGGLVFVDLRDREGLVQVVVSPEGSQAAHAKADDLRVEYVLSVRGTVRARPAGTENRNIPTGEIEVAASSLAILNESKPIPFALEDDTDVAENVRLKYRYLDLRRLSVQQGFIRRSLLARATIVEQGEPVVHMLYGGELRIDVPLPPKADQPAAAPMPAAVPAAKPAETKPAEKPLSPLEKLRLEREKAKAAAKK